MSGKIDPTRIGPVVEELMERVARLETVLGVREMGVESDAEGDLPALELQHRGFVARLRAQERS